MTDKCKLPDCDNKLVHTEGRRPKEFCSPECRTIFHNSKKVKGGQRGRPKGSKNKPTTTVGVLKTAIENMGNTPVVVNEDEVLYDKIEFANTTPESYDGKGVDRIKLDEAALFDFSQDVFLNIEKHTKYPKKDRPTNKGEAITWDNIKKESDQKIKDAWNKRKATQ